MDGVGHLDRIRLCDNRYSGRSPRYCDLAEERRSAAFSSLERLHGEGDLVIRRPAMQNAPNANTHTGSGS